MTEQTLANARAQASGRGFRANRAFIVESLVLLAFLALAVALVLQLFAAAGLASGKAHSQSIALQLAGNAAERFAADPHALDEPQYFDADGQKLSEDGPASAYKVSADVEPSLTPAGRFYDAQVKVEAIGSGTLQEPYVIHTSRYSSEDGVGVRVAEAAVDMDAVGENAVGEEELTEAGTFDEVPPEGLAEEQPAGDDGAAIEQEGA